ncbi:MAG: DEAD/DEAH box helicase family protein [Candidatus Poribacteria bacterium]|nr:DEAD/DEAH box helicase family protein [Candidatus Poribacteria bacterium]
MPCGTGKTRVSLRIMEELTPSGELAIVLCPSIALVAQIRREYLQYTKAGLRTLAVCSDKTAGYAPGKEGTRNTAKDPTVDNSNVSASEVKGEVTTDSGKIADWISQGQNTDRISVIFGTYQSGRPIADALRSTNVTAKILIADEAHRTAGLRKNNAPKEVMSEDERRVRDFTLCHDNAEFPAIFRLYQTATPRIYDTQKVDTKQQSNPHTWIVRSMDDETVFGVELYRKSYVESVKNRWLSDYRIIALGINSKEAYDEANRLANKPDSASLNTLDYLRGLAFALVMGGSTQADGHFPIPAQLKSCIAFMNRVDKSKRMASALNEKEVKTWVDNNLNTHIRGTQASEYTLEHLDATSSVTQRDDAKRRLASATESAPHGVINVGIFGEGTDSPSLSAVAFLEPRKSPIDVIQAVGRAMRTAPGKTMGYIVCPVLIPPNADPEQHLSASNEEEGWKELGQILRALRSHDQRIEDNLEGLLMLYLPSPPPKSHTFVAVALHESGQIQYGVHEGQSGTAQKTVEEVLAGNESFESQFKPVQTTYQADEEPTGIITGKKNQDSSVEMRLDTVARTKPKHDEPRGKVDIEKTKKKARKMINDGAGIKLDASVKTQEKPLTRMQLYLKDLSENEKTISMNLLAKSGLTNDRITRDLNLLEDAVNEAAFHLRAERLREPLNKHFQLHNMTSDAQAKTADGCVIASLLMMNAAMLHQRISNGKWLPGVSDLLTLKNNTNIVKAISREWPNIMKHDFHAIFDPALTAIYAIEDTGKIAGLERALRHICAEAERIAETYADMGADHAGALFNKIMGNQASDGAYFTRPVAASIAARLTLDACGDVDWTDEQVWTDLKIVDLACGSGTLLTAMLTDMKRRAKKCGANELQLTSFQKTAVEETIKGLDINPISLQLAASQHVSYRKMGLFQMPYGPHPDNEYKVSTGTLELLGQSAIVERQGELDGIPDEEIASKSVWPHGSPELEEAVEAVKDAKIVIMNPPFTNRAKMGEKFPKQIKDRLCARTDAMEKCLTSTFMDKNTCRPLFVALADKILSKDDGIMTSVVPTMSLTSASGLSERKFLAERYHVHTVLTCHQPKQINLSQNCDIGESIIVLRRRNYTSEGTQLQTRFISLDKMPTQESEVEKLHWRLLECTQGLMADGWGEVSYCTEEQMLAGDWSSTVWRSPKLAEAHGFFTDSRLLPLGDNYTISRVGDELLKKCVRATEGEQDSFFVVDTAGKDGQRTIQSRPDRQWRTKPNTSQDEFDTLLQSAGHLLITGRQDSASARVTAIASTTKYVSTNAWRTVPNVSADEAKALAVYLNSTPGRLQMGAIASRKITYPMFSLDSIRGIPVPDRNAPRVMQVLADCWERTKDTVVPQYREGECQVRQVWDDAVADAMGWAPEELTRLRHLLHKEPHVRGLGFNQYADAPEGG